MQNIVVRYLLTTILVGWVYLLPSVWKLELHSFTMIVIQLPAIYYFEVGLRRILTFSRKYRDKMKLNLDEEITIFDIHGRVRHKLDKNIIQKVNTQYPMLAGKLKNKFLVNFIVGVFFYYFIIIISFVLSAYLNY